MMRFKKTVGKAGWLVAVPLLVLLSSCSLLDNKNGPLEEARAAKRRWVQADIHDYTFELRRACYCPMQSVRIRVEADTIHSVTKIETGEPVASVPADLRYTISGLFDWLIDQLRQRPDGSQAMFDDTHYYPRDLYIDPRSNVLDDEVSIHVKNFQKHQAQN